MTRRFGIVPIGVALILILVAWIVTTRVFEARAEAAQARDLALSQAEQLTKNIRQYKASLEAAESSQAETPMLWPTMNDAPPISAAQRAINEIINNAGGTLLSLSGGQPTTIGNVAALRLTLEAEGDLSQWQRVMQTISQHEPILLVSEAELRRLNRLPEASTQPLVLFRLTVEVPFAGEAG